MEWLCPVVGVSLLVMLVITLVGHLLWVFFASIFGALSDKTPTPPPAPPTGSRMAELSIAARQADQLCADGRISTHVHGQFMEAIQQERTRLLGVPVRPLTAVPVHPLLTPPVAPPTKPTPPAPPEPKPPRRPLPTTHDKRGLTRTTLGFLNACKYCTCDCFRHQAGLYFS